MPFKYRAYDKDKKVVKGVLSSSTESLAIDTLVKAGLRILSLKEVTRSGVSSMSSSMFKVKSSHIVLFTRQLAMLLERGTGFITALRLSHEQIHNGKLKDAVGQVIASVEAGNTYSSAIGKYPSVFPLAYSRMIKIGEQTGKIEEILMEIAALMEHDETIRKKIKSAMTYPTFILVLGILTSLIMILVVLPSITDLFSTFELQLPWSTRLLLSVQDFAGNYWSYILIIFLPIVLFISWYSRRPAGRLLTERLLWSLPVIKRLYLLRTMQNFSQTMSILLGVGTPLMDAIAIAKQSASSEFIRRSLSRIPNRLLQGKTLSGAMKADPIFPSILSQMVVLGEGTNTLDNSFGTMADHYNFEFNESMESFTSLLGPVLMLAVGSVIGFMAISIISPIYSIYSAI